MHKIKNVGICTYLVVVYEVQHYLELSAMMIYKQYVLKYLGTFNTSL